MNEGRNPALTICWCGSMVEQRYRKPQVEGSIPFTSSKNDKPQGEITLWFFLARTGRTLDINPKPDVTEQVLSGKLPSILIFYSRREAIEWIG